MTITASQIQSASQALRAVLRFDYPADSVLSRYFRDLRELGARAVLVKGSEIQGTYVDDRHFKTIAPKHDGLIDLLRKNNVAIKVEEPSEQPWYFILLMNALPMLVFLGLWIFVMRQVQMGAGKGMSFGKSRAKLLTESQHRVTFADVAGIAIAAGYSVGRTGCWAVGDDYGRPFTGFFATQFPEGAPPSTVAGLNATAVIGPQINLSWTAATDKTSHCDTNSARVPAKKKPRARPERPSAPGVPSAAAVLQAERMTQSASSFRSAISPAVSKPSSASVADCGGVSTRPGSRSRPKSPATRPWVAKAMTR
mgnify:CR=1 FL=1